MRDGCRGCANFIRRSTELWLHPTTGRDFRKNGGPHSLITETVPMLEKSKEILGVDHPSTLSTMNNLVLTYRQQGRTKDACELHEEVLEKCKEILGVDHPSTLSTMNNLALTYRQQGQTKDAC